MTDNSNVESRNRRFFGNHADALKRFPWTAFYEAMATALLKYKDNRAPLVAKIHEIISSVGLSSLEDQFKDKTQEPLKDICPFTTFGTFNRGTKTSKRREIASQLATFLGVEEKVPDSFDGIPRLNSQNSWFFAYEKNRKGDEIDNLWSVFEAAIQYADCVQNDQTEQSDKRDVFAEAFMQARQQKYVKWNLTCGLYWIRPWFYMTLDRNSRPYIKEKLNLQTGAKSGLCTAKEYLILLEKLNGHFAETEYPVHSFPELSYAAWVSDPIDPLPLPVSGYNIDDILADGCFLERSALETMLQRLQEKRNLILQGPPGTGKTWLAKRLAFAKVGEKNHERVRAVQFHANLSYEDFVRGWRPTAKKGGKLELVDGPFLEMVAAANNDPENQYAIVIEEINRGNPAQIFGEMLTLIEADKRTPSEGMSLSYAKTRGERVHVPKNLFVIGTMNIADRSLALVDFALRRRFAFIDLKPVFGKPWRDWLAEQCKIDRKTSEDIERRIIELNKRIANDKSLGEPFCIGHSYVTPPHNVEIKEARSWFRQVVETEIEPLLNEYWFDMPDEVRTAKTELLKGM